MKFFSFFARARWSALADHPKHKKARAGQLNRGHQKTRSKAIATSGTPLTLDPLEEES